MSASMVSSYAPPMRQTLPHRKPLPAHSNPSQQDNSPRYSMQPQAQAQAQPSYNSMNSTRRTLSNATTSTTSSGPSHQNSIRRSSSGRSTAGPSPTSYVALLRKQKATVWCDRSQAEDPRIRIQQRLAKERAEKEVAAGPNGVRRATPPVSSAGGSFTGGVARKIRHHGGKPVQYTGGNMAGAGVPMRLSATEVEDEQENSRDSKHDEDLSEWEKDPSWGYTGQRPNDHHRRTGSGRSSLGSQRRGGAAYNTRFSTASSTPTSGHSRSPSETHLQDLAEETPVPSAVQRRVMNGDYFEQSGGTGGSGGSGSSGNSDSRENSFGDMGKLPPKKERESRDTTEDLMRRGSVDERTMTMGRGVRLFVANPDVDSD